jgi:hypothetical protein
MKLKRPQPDVLEELTGTTSVVTKPLDTTRRPLEYKKRPHIGVLMARSYYILEGELRLLQEKVDRGEQLEAREALQFSKYAEVLTRLAKEERDQDKDNDPSSMSDAELAIAARAALAELGPGEPEGQD